MVNRATTPVNSSQYCPSHSKSICQTVLLCSLVLFSLFSCDQPTAFDCIKSAGSLRSETKEFSSFKEILVEDNIDLFLINDSTNLVRVEGGKNLIGKIRFEQQGNVLRIYNANRCNWARSYDNRIKVTVSVQNLSSITNQGYGVVSGEENLRINGLSILILASNGNVSLSKVQATDLYIYTDCSPTVTLTGQAVNFGAWFRETGKLLAENLRAENCTIKNSSANEMRVFPTKKLTATIEASGNILYFNKPEIIDHHITGKGRLIQKE